MGGGIGGGIGGGVGAMSVMGNDPQKMELVSQIKSFQRIGEAQKQAWWDHCDQNLGGIRDPAKHDTGTLQNFVHSYGVGPALITQPAAGAPLNTSMDPEKSMYVGRIKAYQRTDPSYKE